MHMLLLLLYWHIKIFPSRCFQAFEAVSNKFNKFCFHSWVMMPCCDWMVRQHCRESGCLHLQGNTTTAWCHCPRTKTITPIYIYEQISKKWQPERIKLHITFLDTYYFFGHITSRYYLWHICSIYEENLTKIILQIPEKSPV